METTSLAAVSPDLRAMCVVGFQRMCRDREMLADRYHADLRVYLGAEQSLDKALGANFSQALERADRARRVFERARDELNAHLLQHRCQMGLE